MREIGKWIEDIDNMISFEMLYSDILTLIFEWHKKWIWTSWRMQLMLFGMHETARVWSNAATVSHVGYDFSKGVSRGVRQK